MNRRLELVFRAFERLGPLGAIRYLTCLGMAKLGVLPKRFTLSSRMAQYPLVCRRGTSDISVFNQIFILGEYDCIDSSAGDIKTVLDCGANVGYSAAYFLSRFTNCQVVAIEPDSGNVEILAANLEKYGSRAQIMKAAIWPRETTLNLVDSNFRGGQEWALQVQEAEGDDARNVTGIDIANVLEYCNWNHVDVLKMDIEGAEVPVFSGSSFSQWVAKVGLIAIELHSDSVFGDGVKCFLDAMHNEPFQLHTVGEITVAKRITLGE